MIPTAGQLAADGLVSSTIASTPNSINTPYAQHDATAARTVIDEGELLKVTTFFESDVKGVVADYSAAVEAFEEM